MKKEAKCINCEKKEWEHWKAHKISRENESLCNRLACSEKCFLEWWEK